MEESFKTAQENAVTDALLDKTEVTKYPEDKLKDEIEFNENYYKEYAKSMGITYKEMIQQMGYDDEDTYKKELEDYAKENVKYYLMCDAIAEEEGITVSDSDYKEKATALAKEYDYKTLTAMEREYTKDRIKEVLNAREVTKNTNFNYTKKSEESTGDTTINTNASDATVTTTTEDSTTSTAATEEGTSTEK